MCCNKKNRYTFGIIIGSAYTELSSVVFILSIYSFFQVNDGEDAASKQEYAIIAMATSLVTALISALFIFALIKKHHNLIIPWLILCIAVFLGSCVFILISFFVAGWSNAPYEVLLIILLIGACFIALEIAIFCYSCCLYREIRKNNIGSEKL